MSAVVVGATWRDVRAEGIKFRKTVWLGVLSFASLVGFSAWGALSAAGSSASRSAVLVDVVTSVMATVGPVLAVVAGAVIFGSEFRWRLVSTAITLYGSVRKVVVAKVSLVTLAALGALGLGTCVATATWEAYTLPSAGAEVASGSGGPTAVLQKALIGLLGVVFWFTASALLTVIFRNGVFGLLLTGCYVLLETPLLLALGGQDLPTPLSVQMSGYWILSYPEGGLVTAPEAVMDLNIPMSVALTLAYIALFTMLLTRALRRRAPAGT